MPKSTRPQSCCLSPAPHASVTPFDMCASLLMEGQGVQGEGGGEGERGEREEDDRESSTQVQLRPSVALDPVPLVLRSGRVFNPGVLKPRSRPLKSGSRTNQVESLKGPREKAEPGRRGEAREGAEGRERGEDRGRRCTAEFPSPPSVAQPIPLVLRSGKVFNTGVQFQRSQALRSRRRRIARSATHNIGDEEAHAQKCKAEEAGGARSGGVRVEGVGEAGLKGDDPWGEEDVKCCPRTKGQTGKAQGNGQQKRGCLHWEGQKGASQKGGGPRSQRQLRSHKGDLGKGVVKEEEDQRGQGPGSEGPKERGRGREGVQGGEGKRRRGRPRNGNKREGQGRQNQGSESHRVHKEERKGRGEGRSRETADGISCAVSLPLALGKRRRVEAARDTMDSTTVRNHASNMLRDGGSSSQAQDAEADVKPGMNERPGLKQALTYHRKGGRWGSRSRALVVDVESKSGRDVPGSRLLTLRKRPERGSPSSAEKVQASPERDAKRAREASVRGRAGVMTRQGKKSREHRVFLTDKRPDYVHTDRNVYLIKKPRLESLEDNFCACSGSKAGCGHQCLCRVQYMSCWEDCGCTQCGNRPFEREKKIHVVKTEDCGWGVIAAEDIREGELVVEYAGEIIDDSMCEKRLWKLKARGFKHWYFCELSKDFVIDATVKGGYGRFVNHSCSPNAAMEKWRVGDEMRVGIFATRNIKAGEEVSYDYNFTAFGSDEACHCKAPNCRGTISAKAGESRG